MVRIFYHSYWFMILCMAQRNPTNKFHYLMLIFIARNNGAVRHCFILTNLTLVWQELGRHDDQQSGMVTASYQFIQLYYLYDGLGYLQFGRAEQDKTKIC